MGKEFNSFLAVWTSAAVALAYAFQISRRVTPGLSRCIFLLPVVFLFFFIPFYLSTVHLCGITAFFLSWLANFKLLLLAFGIGPLSHPSLHLPGFILVGCFPIQIKYDASQHGRKPSRAKIVVTEFIFLPLKVAALAILFRMYEYRPYLNREFVFALYCLNLYFELDFVLALTAALARGVIGLEIEPQIRAPYLATSLQDFWGRRWNLMVPSILRQSVYNPIRKASELIVNTELARLVGLLSAFTVSGIMHELMYYYVSRVPPTWELTWFFVLQGVCTGVEMGLKTANGVTSGRWRLHGAVSGPLVVGFVATTGVWLFLHQPLRDGMVEKTIGEGIVASDYILKCVL